MVSRIKTQPLDNLEPNSCALLQCSVALIIGCPVDRCVVWVGHEAKSRLEAGWELRCVARESPWRLSTTCLRSRVVCPRFVECSEGGKTHPRFISRPSVEAPAVSW